MKNTFNKLEILLLSSLC